MGIPDSFLTFPTIAHLSLHECGITALQALGKGENDVQMVWPKLRTITIEYGIGSTFLYAAVLARKESGIPISKIYLHNRVLSHLKRGKHLTLLREIVDVQKWSHREVWPPGLTYEDEDDTFWDFI